MAKIVGLNKVKDIKTEMDRLIDHYDKYMLRSARKVWITRDQRQIITEYKDAAEHLGIHQHKMGQFVYRNYEVLVSA